MFPESIVPSSTQSVSRRHLLQMATALLASRPFAVLGQQRVPIADMHSHYGLITRRIADSGLAEDMRKQRVALVVSPVDFDRPVRVEQRSWPAFIQGLRSLGWIEGENIVFERHPTHDYTRLQQAAEEFVRMNVDVIVLGGGARAAVVQNVTRTIPIVTLAAGDLVASGLVPSLARPAGNITGMQSYAPEMMGKRLQMLKELVPTLSRVAVLRRDVWAPGILAVYRQATDDAAQKLGIRVRYIQFQNADALPGVFAEMVKERDTALLIWDDPRVDQLAGQIRDLAVKYRLPTMRTGPRSVPSWPTARRRTTCTGKRRHTWIASWEARSRPTCPSGSPPPSS